MLSPDNSMENQLTLSSVKRLPGPSAVDDPALELPHAYAIAGNDGNAQDNDPGENDYLPALHKDSRLKTILTSEIMGCKRLR